MKKLLLASLLVLGLAQANDNEFAIGPLVHVNNNGNNDVDATIKYGSYKFDIGDNTYAVEKLFVQGDLFNTFGWFLGFGAYLYTDIASQTYTGLRIPIGITYDLNANFDIFFQHVYSYELDPTAGNNGTNQSVGLRYYF